jgi:hypothetical protein
MSVAFHTITPHAIRALKDDVKGLTNQQAWLSLYWLYWHGHDASEYELRILAKPFEAEVVYRICDCCWGTYIMVIKRGVMFTCYERASYLEYMRAS